MEEKEYEVRTLIGDACNARTGREKESVGIQNGKKRKTKRESKDKKINKKGRKLIQFIEEKN